MAKKIEITGLFQETTPDEKAQGKGDYKFVFTNAKNYLAQVIRFNVDEVIVDYQTYRVIAESFEKDQQGGEPKDPFIGQIKRALEERMQALSNECNHTLAYTCGKNPTLRERFFEITGNKNLFGPIP